VRAIGVVILVVLPTWLVKVTSNGKYQPLGN
jgi:hypothetical protein